MHVNLPEGNGFPYSYVALLEENELAMIHNDPMKKQWPCNHMYVYIYINPVGG